MTGPGGLSGRSASCGFAGLPFPGIALRDRGGWPAGRDGAGRGGRAIRGGSSAGLNATGGLVEESVRMAPGGLFGGEDAPAAGRGARAGGARGEDRLPGRGSARGGHEGGGELVRRRRSRESDAGSGKRRLIFCPSPFAVARLPFAPPSSLPVFCARSVCPPYPFSLPFAFVAVFLSFASTGRLRFLPAFSWLDRVPMRPFPGKTRSARAFRPGATRPSPWAIPGRPGVPSSCRIGPGESGPLSARSIAGTRGPEGGAAASGPSSAISGITNGIISGITKGGEQGGRSSAPGFLRAFRRSIGRPDGSRRWIPPGLAGRRRRGGLGAEQCH